MMFISLITLSASLLFLRLGAAANSVRELYEFSGDTALENISIRPSGELVLTSSNDGHLYTLNPQSVPLEPQVAVLLPNVSAASGIAQTAPDQFVVIGGVLNETISIYVDGTANAYLLDFESNSSAATINKIVPIPHPGLVNGIAALPGYSDVVLGADSAGGRIVRIDTRTAAVETVFQDPGLEYPDGASRPLGVNGIKIFQGYVYFTNMAKGTFGRVTISPDGRTFGQLEVVADLQTTETIYGYDDFALDESGTAYVATPTNDVNRIFPNGTQSTIVGGGNSTLLKSPTSLAMSLDGKSVYVITTGEGLDGVSYGGQIAEISL